MVWSDEPENSIEITTTDAFIVNYLELTKQHVAKTADVMNKSLDLS